jgi:hypothetical protein
MVASSGAGGSRGIPPRLGELLRADRDGERRRHLPAVQPAVKDLIGFHVQDLAHPQHRRRVARLATTSWLIVACGDMV